MPAGSSATLLKDGVREGNGGDLLPMDGDLRAGKLGGGTDEDDAESEGRVDRTMAGGPDPDSDGPGDVRVARLMGGGGGGPGLAEGEASEDTFDDVLRGGGGRGARSGFERALVRGGGGGRGPSPLYGFQFVDFNGVLQVGQY
ncbi:hypothetical protein V5O48_012450 [Marasmius crinis-equi]|uniref:Uncharacterized protein n=1 Tax=Marasmius crinis-equi TaxID=585013 RepID=A0ABR3F325_9AGAR